jgi:DNA-binding NarL/FixJ family response regulator
MTRIFMLVDEQVQIQLESPLPAVGLTESINNGEIPAVISERYPGEIPPLRAIGVGSLVVVLPALVLPEVAQPRPMLSPRQQIVLQALAQGLTNRQIARRLGLSPRSVEYHLAVLRQRLGQGSRPQLVARAVALGLLKTPPG